MGFWIFMLIMDLLIPLTMLGFGKLFMKMAPKTINYAFGYRTNRSMKNQDTWEFAHHYCGKIWFWCGLVMTPLTIVAMLFVIGGSEDLVGTVGGWICSIQLVPMIGSILPTELALRKNFDKDGRRK